MNKTPEREAYEREEAAFLNAMQIIADKQRTLVEEAHELGLVITIETLPLQPPAMGNYEFGIEVRLSRDITKLMAELRQAAEASEKDRDTG